MEALVLNESFWTATIKSFIALIIIIDPFLATTVFIGLTKGMDKKEKANQALIATLVALGLLLVFLFSGLIILTLLGITFSSFIVAGGVLLFILGIQTVLGIEFSKPEHKDTKIAAIIIGTPLLSGPGAMTTVVILSQKYGYWPPVIASIVALFITWVMMYFSEAVERVLGERIIEVLSRVLGLVLAAMAAEFIKNGVSDMIREFKT